MKQILLVLLLTGISLNAQQSFKRVLKLMGSRFEITVVAQNKTQADYHIDQAVAEISRIEKLISSWDPASETSEVNRQAGIQPIKVSAELFELISRCIELSKLTDGAFDISYASMDRLWKFDGSMKELPSAQEIKASVARVGYQKILIDEISQTIFLRENGMKIGFGAIGKGYAADMAKDLLLREGVVAGIINAAGDMSSWGTQPGGKPWQVAITNPMDKTKSFGLLPMGEGAVVTSGDYEKFVRFNGKRYSHIMDPRTGYPATGIISATVFAPKAELADALSTALFVMGIETGLDRINQLEGIECIIVDDSGKLFTSQRIDLKKLE
ncbi:MAG: FAD:protein FMN transferase [Robiginitalea sp.]|uniref:FAD:protein FMN transferase n=1 Tax=Robiginitalea sp. TaxID=1902411 RepID=UPI003C71608D